jgi:hypothetical protein
MKTYHNLYITAVVVLLSYSTIHAQKSSPLTSSQLGSMILIEKKMQRIGNQFLMDTSQDQRLKGAREFVKLLVESLKTENSFQYQFDSLPYLAKVSPNDTSFRIFTFQVMLKDYTFLHYGCIQFNRKNIKLIPLKDFSDTFAITPQFTITNKNWLGAVYYKLITKEVNNKPIYFLFGYDQNDYLTDKKYIEAMTIEKDSIARFGLPIFEKTYIQEVARTNKLGSMSSKPIPPTKITKIYHRYLLEYRKRASVILKYDKEKDLITHDHIESLDAKAQDVGFMKVPDGSYEGLRWDKSKWVWVDYIKMSNDEESKIPIKKDQYKGSKIIPK